MKLHFPYKQRNLPVYGFDTELYTVDGRQSLKSIQVSTPDGDEVYITTDDWDRDDWSIREDICHQFAEWIREEFTDHGGIIVAHNLEFDFSQIIKCFRKEFTYTEKEGKKDDNTIMVREDPQKVYSATITVGKYSLYFRDTFKFATGSLQKVAKDWKLTLQKVEIDSKIFPKAPATEEERHYAMVDAHVARELWNKLQSAGLVNETQYSTAGSATIGNFMDYLDRCHYNFYKLFYGVNTYKAGWQDEVKEKQEEFEECGLRYSNKGGLTIPNRKGIHEHVDHYDYNSMYPSQMVHTYTPVGCVLREPPKSGVLISCGELPKGETLGMRTPYTYLLAPRGEFRLKEGMVPCIQWKTINQCRMYSLDKEYTPSDYVGDFFLDGSFHFWKDEWDIILQCYDFVGDEGDDFIYFECMNNVLLRNYVNTVYNKKRNATNESERNLAKMYLNSLYGKFLSRPDGERITYRNGVREREDVDDREMYYLPLGSWIAMMGRVTLMKAILSLEHPSEDFYYSDTDSIFCRHGAKLDISIGKELGQAKMEHEDVMMSLIGAKTYQLMWEDEEGVQVVTKCAGLSTEITDRLAFGELQEGNVYMKNQAIRNPDTEAKEVRQMPHIVSTRVPVIYGRY